MEEIIEDIAEMTIGEQNNVTEKDTNSSQMDDIIENFASMSVKENVKTQVTNTDEQKTQKANEKTKKAPKAAKEPKVPKETKAPKEPKAPKATKEPKANEKTKNTEQQVVEEEEVEIQTIITTIGDKEYLMDQDSNIYDRYPPNDHIGIYNHETKSIDFL